MPNFDVWYPLGISATLYSIMTVWLAVKRLLRKLRKILGLSPTARESNLQPSRKARTEYPIAPVAVRPLEMQSVPAVLNNDI